MTDTNTPGQQPGGGTLLNPGCQDCPSCGVCGGWLPDVVYLEAAPTGFAEFAGGYFELPLYSDYDGCKYRTGNLVVNEVLFGVCNGAPVLYMPNPTAKVLACGDFTEGGDVVELYLAPVFFQWNFRVIGDTWEVELFVRCVFIFLADYCSSEWLVLIPSSPGATVNVFLSGTAQLGQEAIGDVPLTRQDVLCYYFADCFYFLNEGSDCQDLRDLNTIDPRGLATISMTP